MDGSINPSIEQSVNLLYSDSMATFRLFLQNININYFFLQFYVTSAVMRSVLLSVMCAAAADDFARTFLSPELQTALHDGWNYAKGEIQNIVASVQFDSPQPESE